MALAAELKWVRPPQQDRSRRPLDRLLDATAALLTKQPFEAVSVNDIVQRARSSIGSFYARFADKDSLLRYLQERLYSEARATIEQALEPALWEGVPLAEL